MSSHLLGLLLFLDIEAQILEIQSKKATLVEEGQQGVGLDSTGFYDQEIYGGGDSRFVGYVTSIPANEQEEVSISISVVCVCFFLGFFPLSFVPVRFHKYIWSLTAPVCLLHMDWKSLAI